MNWKKLKRIANSKIVQKFKFVTRMCFVKGLRFLSPFLFQNLDFSWKIRYFQKMAKVDKKLDIVDNADKNTQYCVNFAFFTCVFRPIIYNIYDGLGLISIWRDKI